MNEENFEKSNYLKIQSSRNRIKLKSNPTNLLVLHEDNHLIVINKRPGDIIQGDKTGDIPLSEVVKQYLKENIVNQAMCIWGLFTGWTAQLRGLLYLQKPLRPYLV